MPLSDLFLHKPNLNIALFLFNKEFVKRLIRSASDKGQKYNSNIDFPLIYFYQ